MTLFFISLLYLTIFPIFTVEKSPINWAPTITNDTLYSAQSTWDEHFKKTINPSIDAAAFFKAAQSGIYFETSIKDLLKMGMENHRLRNYDCSKNAETAYPPHDRPRKQVDIESVRYLCSTQDPISPILLVQVTDRKGRSHLIKLDGMHRLVAACIRRSSVRCFVINLGKASLYKNTKAFLKGLLTLE